MRNWRFAVLVLLVFVMLLSGSVAEAGGLLDNRDAIRALTPFFIFNAVLTAALSTFVFQGCNNNAT